jgi:hypothetical protein
MKKDRDDRFPDLATLVQALAPFASPTGQAAAQRIADGRGAPVSRDSSPMLPVLPAAPAPAAAPPPKLKGTMVMADAPNAIQAARNAAAQAAAAQKNGTAAMPQASMQPQMQQPQASAVPLPPQGSHVPVQNESGRWTPANAYPPANAATPPGQFIPTPPQPLSAVPAPPATKASGGMSKGVLFGILAGCVLLFVAGLTLIIVARH